MPGIEDQKDFAQQQAELRVLHNRLPLFEKRKDARRSKTVSSLNVYCSENLPPSFPERGLFLPLEKEGLEGFYK